MTLFDAAGVYVGWDRGGYPHLAYHYFHGSLQLQLGLLLIGCDWFFKETYARTNGSTLQREDR